MWTDWDIERLEREYSPSSCVDDYEALISDYSAKSANAEKATTVLKDIEYGDADDELLDIFPSQAQNAPLLIFIHGGYWQYLSKNESTFSGAQLAESHIALAVIDYTIAPEGQMEQMVDQCVRSILWLHKHAERYGYSRDKIYISGSSAGAHLAAMAILQLKGKFSSGGNSIVRGCVLMSGVYDLTPIIKTYINEPLGLDETRAKNMSPILLDLSGFPPSIICWGENETNEFKRQSQDFSAILSKTNVDIRSFEIKGVNHFDIVHKLGNLVIADDTFDLP